MRKIIVEVKNSMEERMQEMSLNGEENVKGMENMGEK